MYWKVSISDYGWAKSLTIYFYEDNNVLDPYCYQHDTFGDLIIPSAEDANIYYQGLPSSLYVCLFLLCVLACMIVCVYSTCVVGRGGGGGGGEGGKLTWKMYLG